MKYLNTVTLEQPFGQVVSSARDALAGQGFGVLTEIDVQATVKAKLDVDVDPYIILGACNPTFAHRALQIEPSLGVLLPCNVVVRAEGANRTVVEAIDPSTLVMLTENDDLAPTAQEVATRLQAVLKSLSPPTND